MEMVIVHTKTGKSFKGVAYDRRSKGLVLKNAEILTPNGAKPVDGEVFILDVDIDFTQVLNR